MQKLPTGINRGFVKVTIQFKWCITYILSVVNICIYIYGKCMVYVWYKNCKCSRTYVSLIISSTKFTKFVTY